MDLGDNSVCKECAMICTDAYSDEEYKEMVVYGDQGITSRKFDEDTYGDLMNTDSNEEHVVKYNVALCTQDSVSLEKKRRRLNRDKPSEDENQLSLSHNKINITDNEEAINNENDTVQGPTSYDDEIESWKAWTMRMPTIDGDISMMETEELAQIEDNNKKSLYARAVHANHMIQHHMHEILECQRVVDEYRSMADGGRDMIPLESTQYKNDLVINQHIMQMIDTDIFCYGKTFKAILMELQKIRNGKSIAKPVKESSMEETHCCNDSHAMFNDSRLYKGEKTQQDHKATESIIDEHKAQIDWPRKCVQMDEKEPHESAMMCWESLDDSEQASKKQKTCGEVVEMNDDKNKQADELDYKTYSKHTANTGNQLNIPVDELKLGADNDTSTLATQETSVKNLVYITNIPEDKLGTTKNVQDSSKNSGEQDD